MLIGASCSWKTYSRLRVLTSTWKSLPDELPTSMRRCSRPCSPPPPARAASMATSRNISPSWCCSGMPHTCSLRPWPPLRWRSRQKRTFS